MTFQAECQKCFGLCCTALSFERGSQFGHDKPAGQPCLYLADDFRCRIHARREELGYDGCEAFDCLGAGQRASARFADENWRGDAGVARRLHGYFSLLMRLQEMRQALTTAAELDLGTGLHGERQVLLTRIAALAESGDEEAGEAAAMALADAKAFLRRLAPELTQ
ncbi:hypothetical protein [Devosia faecipullorum]|uniref:hypothetical protein n=1 Tax=Devosia faecipullorum TaxID=2755039 RepID=UPI00187B2EA7|nr:hypothetical protein [Devosia faecipullorum]MBE7733011.1 hypothetical protein [Devosia faecipullorum]